MYVFRLISLWLMLHLAAAWASHSPALDLQQLHQEPIGQDLHVLNDTSPGLTPASALFQFQHTATPTHSRKVIGLGIGHAPIWVYFQVNNPESQPVRRHLVIGQSWLDKVDVYLFQQTRLLATHRTGDTVAGAPYLNEALGYDLEAEFPPGNTDILVRVASKDPMLLDIRLMDTSQTNQVQQREHYLYGVLYGFIASLAVYNLLLYVGMGRRTGLRYSVYLLSFIALNMAYTGHLLAWLLRDHPHLNSYLIYALMLLFNITGLQFSRQFLELATLLPRTDRTLGMTLWLLPAIYVLLAALGQQTLIGYVAFCNMTLFVFIMAMLGLVAWQKGRQTAKYFLAAASISMAGILLTLFSAWGAIPFTTLSFRGLELGIMAEASLLALALADYIRTQQRQRLQAERDARIDLLTRLNNRRGFLELAEAAFPVAQRHQRPLALLMIDIDHFRKINDQMGHPAGDLALTTLANTLSSHIRCGDCLARWAGEAFLLLLPETTQEEAESLAGNLLQSIRALTLQHQQAAFGITISIGIAALTGQATLDQLIQQAEAALQLAKQRGRNQFASQGNGPEHLSAGMHTPNAVPG